MWIISLSLLRYQHSITLQVPSFISIDERFEEHQESVETELGYQRTSGKLSDEWESVLRATKYRSRYSTLTFTSQNNQEKFKQMSIVNGIVYKWIEWHMKINHCQQNNETTIKSSWPPHEVSFGPFLIVDNDLLLCLTEVFIMWTKPV